MRLAKPLPLYSKPHALSILLDAQSIPCSSCGWPAVMFLSFLFTADTILSHLRPCPRESTNKIDTQDGFSESFWFRKSSSPQDLQSVAQSFWSQRDTASIGYLTPTSCVIKYWAPRTSQLAISLAWSMPRLRYRADEQALMVGSVCDPYLVQRTLN